MSIVDKIKSNVAALSGLPCYYGGMEELNVIMCNATFPCFYFAQLTETEIEENNGNYTERVRVALISCDKTEFDPDSTENEQIIDACKGRIFDVIRAIGAEGNVEVRSFNAARRVYQEFDVIVTGYAVNIDFAELYGNTGCDIAPITMAITANGVYDVRGVQQVDVDVQGQIVAVHFQAFKAWEGMKGYFEGRAVVPHVTTMAYMFNGCSQLRTIDLHSWDTSSVTTMSYMFGGCRQLQIIDLRGISAAGMTSTGWCSYMFVRCKNLTSVVGGMSYEDVVARNIKVFADLSVTIPSIGGWYWGHGQGCPDIDRASTRAVFNGLADMTGQASPSIYVGRTAYDKLSAEDIAVATNKNWIIKVW